jgi:DNA-binding MarR family transcriptional regulator
MIADDPVADMDLMNFYRILTRFTDQDGHSLTIRQLAVLLTCYLLDEEHTVRQLAATLHVAKPAVSRMLDHLVVEGLIERRADPRDRRSVLFERTCAGQAFLEGIAKPGLGAVAASQWARNRQDDPYSV